ncbi:tetratricopeptide-like domain-containing protein [Desulfonema limicola]|uniref:Tetratricopeptide-like domain-containing protein n=1 Tax=Desulfonema limicola TaxID=45656 RepID=A0A975GJQ0_9BACT|nr:hypothetical protein [Desulfonema limicola]QTA83819.1 tetratricopeptide-like domain-containing protein [Desulfonema limicola]
MITDRRLCIISFLILIFIWFLAGCQRFPDQSIVKNGKQYGVTHVNFKGEWWHYYERGLSFADGCFWKKAEADFRDAVRMRQKDEKRVRTFGRHWLEIPNQEPGYFPHRELGIVLYRQEKLSEALKELNISLKNIESSRAQLYIDRCRKALIKQEDADRNPPEISIISPNLTESPVFTNKSYIVIQGIVSDDTFVRNITVNSMDVRIDVSQKEIPFRMKIPLVPGKNNISITARDLIGKQTILILPVIADRIGPVISMEKILENDLISDTEVIIRGNIFDNSGVSEIIINNKKFRYRNRSEISVEKNIKFRLEEDDISITAIDSAGNTTFMKMALPDRYGKTYYNNLLTDNSNTGFTDIVISQRAKRKKSAFLASGKDITPPQIELDQFQNGQVPIITYISDLLIQGTVSDESEVRSLWFNREKIYFRGKNNKFSYVQGLKKGRNLITIRGFDAFGNEAKKEVRIIYKIPVVLKEKSRLRIKINDFDEKSLKAGWNQSFKHQFDTAMFKRKRFISILNNMDADCNLNGYIDRKYNYIEIFAYLYDSETKERLAAVNAHREGETPGEKLIISRDTIKELAEEIELKLAHEIPLTEGIVTETDGKNMITTDLGEETLIKKGMKLIVYEKNAKAVNHDFEQLGQGRINTVMKGKSFAIIQENSKQILQGHEVITR